MEGDICDYHPARNLVLPTVSVAAESLARAILNGIRQNWTITLGDFAIRPMERTVPPVVSRFNSAAD